MAREIFISYSRHDKALVYPFVAQIGKAVGRDCWIDLKGIESGEEFEDVIIHAIEECRVVLFMLSDSSLKSPWTKREVYYAEGEGKRIVPVLVDGDKLRGWFKFHFGNVDFINIHSDEHKGKLIRNLKNWLGVDGNPETKTQRLAEEQKAADEKRRAEEQRSAEEWQRREESDQKLREEEALRAKELTFSVGGVQFKMIRVEGGSFLMGAPDNDVDAFSDEKPQHQVTLSDFYIGETQVTQALWKAVMGTNPASFQGDDLPVERVSWDDCQEFIQQLNNRLSSELRGHQFNLPSEAQWEFAARGGKYSKGYKYSGSNEIDQVAWYDGNSGSKIHPVKKKSPNELGLFDMSGNLWEWCLDRYESYSDDSQDNHQDPSSGSDRVGRGGSWFTVAGDCRVSGRGFGTPDGRDDILGLRLAL